MKTSILSESNPFYEGPGREHLEVKAASRKTWDGDARAVNPIEVMPYVDVNSLCIHCTEGGRRSCLVSYG